MHKQARIQRKVNRDRYKGNSNFFFYYFIITKFGKASKNAQAGKDTKKSK